MSSNPSLLRNAEAMLTHSVSGKKRTASGTTKSGSLKQSSSQPQPEMFVSPSEMLAHPNGVITGNAGGGVVSAASNGNGNARLQQNVPAFLNKLFNMVNDTSSNDLIQWSADGTTFIVTKHEDFAKEVLPRFFKHNNFSSFVRQLNMYGFHKVPHLQQGVLISDGTGERWEFSNPNFQRGRPDLLPLVKRKSSRQNGDDSTDLTVANGSIDLKQVLSEISSIKKTQQQITSDLRHMQQENQVLWQESINQREKHQKQQDTIDKILRFLASVFSSEKALKSTVTSKRRRLLLEDNEPEFFEGLANGLGASSAPQSPVRPASVRPVLDGPSTAPSPNLFPPPGSSPPTSVLSPPMSNMTSPPMQSLSSSPMQSLRSPPVQQLGSPPLQQLRSPPVQTMTSPPMPTMTSPPVPQTSSILTRPVPLPPVTSAPSLPPIARNDPLLRGTPFLDPQGKNGYHLPFPVEEMRQKVLHLISGEVTPPTGSPSYTPLTASPDSTPLPLPSTLAATNPTTKALILSQYAPDLLNNMINTARLTTTAESLNDTIDSLQQNLQGVTDTLGFEDGMDVGTFLDEYGLEGQYLKRRDEKSPSIDSLASGDGDPLDFLDV